MIGNWIQNHRISLLILLAFMTIAGIVAAFKIPVALFPNISFPRLSIIIDSGDRPVDRMVIEITRPVEQALRGIPSIIDIRSKSNRGSAEFSVNFSQNTNMTIALLQTQEAINQVLPSLPPGIKFNAKQMSPNIFPMLGLALTSQKNDLVELRDFAEYQLNPLLSAIPGVAHVEILGGKQAEFQVSIDPAKLRSNNLTFDDVTKALTTSTVIRGVGRIEDFYRLYLILSDTRLQQLADIQHTILHTSANGIVELEDIAQIKSATIPEWTRVTANGHDAVLINITQQPGADTVAIVKRLKSRLKDLKKSTDFQIKTYYDQSKLIEQAASSVQDAIIIGAILAALILLLFLGNLSMTIIVAVILPCVLSITILCLYLLNMSFNMMTLGGMAAAVGLIIDDGVVMLEYIIRRLEEPNSDSSLHNPILGASLKMLRPLTGSSLATIIIFLPLAFLAGVSGGFFKALALTMAIGLTVSFFFAFLAVPLFGEMLLKRDNISHSQIFAPLLIRLQRHYQTGIQFFLKKTTWLVLAITLVVVVGGIAYSQVGSGFMPHMDEGGFILDYAAKPGTSLTETDRILRQVEQLIVATPEVDSYSRRTGLQLGGGLTESNIGDFFIRLKKLPRRRIDVIMTELRNKIQLQVPGLQIQTAQLMEDLIGDLTAVPQPIEIKIFGDNPLVLQQTAKKTAALLKNIPGVVEIFDGTIISGDSIKITVDKIRTALLNLDSDIVTKQIQDQLAGNVVSQIQEGQKMIGIRVWTGENLHDHIQSLRRLPIQISSNRYVSLDHIARINVQKGEAEVTRENLKTMVAVTARIDNRDIGSTMRDIRTAMQKLTLPGGIYIQYGGLYQEQQKSFYDLLAVFVGAVLLIMVLLLFLYNDFKITFSILLTVLLSLTGVFLGLWLTATELNLSSLMGMTMIIGIVTEIAIFYFSELKGKTQYNINELSEAGIMRMRPILMTSIITILALLPLALGLGLGSAMQQPLAIAIIFGLILGVPLVLFVMPALYWLISK